MPARSRKLARTVFGLQKDNAALAEVLYVARSAADAHEFAAGFNLALGFDASDIRCAQVGADALDTLTAAATETANELLMGTRALATAHHDQAG